MILKDALQHAGRFSIRPEFSMFHTSSRGEYTHLLTSDSAGDIVDRFRVEAIKPATCGLEVRCDGVRVVLSGLTSE